MKKQEFLSVLRWRLRELPPADVSRTVEYYSEMIDDHIENGMSEASAVVKMGDPNDVAAQILMGSSAKRGTKGQAAKKKGGLGRGWTIALLCLGFPLWFPLLISAAAIVISLYAVLWSVIISLWATFGALVGGAIGGIGLGVVCVMSGNAMLSMLSLSAALVCGGLAILLFCGCHAATRGAAWLTRVTFVKIFVHGKKERRSA
jgi:uncharacterized membrane protein